MKKERSSNFELLRIISILMVITSHLCLFSNFVGKYEILSIESVLIYGLRVGVIANYVFIIITGYFMIDSKIKYNKIISLILQSLFYSILILLFVYFLGIVNLNNKDIIKSFFPIFFGNWFIIYYILLYLLIPFLNKFVKSINEYDFKKLIIILIIINFIIPMITKNIWNFTYHDFFITSYFIGAYLKIYCQDKFKNNKKLIIFLLVFVLFGFLSVYLLKYIGNYFSIIELINKPEYFIRNSYSILPLIIASLLVILFRNLKIKNVKLINYISASTLGIYLIHENYLLRNFIWNEIFSFNGSNCLIQLIIFILIKVFIVFFVCLIIDKIRSIILDNLFNNISLKMCSSLEKILQKGDDNEK